MFGLLDAIYAYLSRMVGNRTDAASSTGSLHAKVADLKSYVTTQIATVQKPRSLQPGGSYTNNSGTTSYQTVLNITGRGRLWKHTLTNGPSGTVTLRITVDGQVVQTIPLSTANATLTTNNADINFKTSLMIEITTTVINNGSCTWQYELE